MISPGLYLLPSISDSEELSNVLISNNVNNLFAVKNGKFAHCIRDNVENGCIQNFTTFECKETIADKHDLIIEPSNTELDWINKHLLQNQNVGIMCANGMQRSVPVLAAYLKQYQGMTCEKTVKLVSKAYPEMQINDPQIYAAFIHKLGWLCLQWKDEKEEEETKQIKSDL